MTESRREPLVIALAQPPCRAGDVAANAESHAATVRTAAARVVVFPELSLTGYELDAPAITVDDDRLAPIVAACAETATVALVGAPLAEESPATGRAVDGSEPGVSSSIAMLAIDGTGVRVAYRKVWLDETENRFTPGEPAVLVVDGWRLGLGICKDTGIAQHQVDTVALGIDVYLAGTVMRPDEAQVQDARARRIAAEHRIHVGFASFAGPTGSGYPRTAGGSGLWGPDGGMLAQAGPDPGDLARATIEDGQPKLA